MRSAARPKGALPTTPGSAAHPGRDERLRPASKGQTVRHRCYRKPNSTPQTVQKPGRPVACTLSAPAACYLLPACRAPPTFTRPPPVTVRLPPRLPTTIARGRRPPSHVRRRQVTIGLLGCSSAACEQGGCLWRRSHHAAAREQATVAKWQISTTTDRALAGEALANALPKGPCGARWGHPKVIHLGRPHATAATWCSRNTPNSKCPSTRPRVGLDLGVSKRNATPRGTSPSPQGDIASAGVDPPTAAASHCASWPRSDQLFAQSARAQADNILLIQWWYRQNSPSPLPWPMKRSSRPTYTPRPNKTTGQSSLRSRPVLPPLLLRFACLAASVFCLRSYAFGVGVCVGDAGIVILYKMARHKIFVRPWRP